MPRMRARSVARQNNGKAVGTAMTIQRSNQPKQQSDGRVAMKAKFPGSCRACKKKITVGAAILWHPTSGNAWHSGCKNQAKKKMNKKHSKTPASRPAKGSVRFVS